MKKNFFKVLLLGVFTLSLGAGFVGCKDYDDDISRIDGEIAALKTELAAAKAQADKGVADAAAAQATANQALTAAQNAASAIPTTAQIEAIARAQADAAIAAAGLQNATQVQALIDAALAGIEAGLTEEDLEDFYTESIQPIVDWIAAAEGRLGDIEDELLTIGYKLAEMGNLEANDNAIALNQLKLQALVFSQYGIAPADYEVLTETIAQLEAGEITAAEIDWDAINDLIASIEDGRLKVKGGVLSTLVFEPMVWTAEGGRAMLFHHHQYLPLTATGKQYIQKTNAAANWVKRTETPIVNYAMNSKLIAESSFLKDNIYFGYKEVATRHGLVAAPKATYMGMQNGNMQVKVTAPAELFWHGDDYSTINSVNYTKPGSYWDADSLDIVQLNVPLAGSDDIVSSDWAILYAKYMPEVHIAFNGPANTKYDKTNVDGKNGSDKTKYFYTIDYFEATDHNINGVVGSTTNRVHQWEPDVLLPFESSLDLLTVVKAAVATATNTAADKMATAANLTGPFPIALTNYHRWTSTDWSTAFEMERLGYTWAFDIVPYTIGTTKQEDFLAIDGTVVTPKTFDQTGTAAIGRTPVIRASIMNGNNIVATAFIKLEITRPITPGLERELTFPSDYFTCSTGLTNDVSVEWMNLQIYNPLQLSKAQFHAAYRFNDVVNTTDVGTVAEAANPSQENTRILTWTITAADAWKNMGKTVTNVVQYDRIDGTAGPVIITFKTAIPKFAPAINVKDIYTSFWTDDKVYFKQNTAVPAGTTGLNILATRNTFVNNVYAGFHNYTVTNGDQEKGKHNWSTIASDYTNFKSLYDGLTVLYNFSSENVRSITVDGVKYDIKRANNNRRLTATVGNGTPQTIVDLDAAPTRRNVEGVQTWQYDMQYHGHRSGSSVTDNISSEYARILLNTDEFTAWIETTAYACGDDTDRTVAVTGDKAKFQVKFIRPVYAEKGNGYWIDAVTGGSKVKVLDAFSLRDWRPNYFEPSNDHLYTFYGITLRDIAINTTNATIERADGTGTVQALQGNVTVERPTGLSYSNRDRIYFVYTNTGNPVSVDHIIKFSASLEYNWGTLQIPVEITLHPSDWTPAP